MTNIVITPPTTIPVSMEAARGALRVDGTDLDSLIEMWVRGIVADMEHEIGQCVMEQTLEVRLPAFPSVQCWPIGAAVPRGLTTSIRLPHPVLSVISVDYIDSAGDQQAMPDSAYRVNKERYASTLTPARGGSWPATAEDAAAVKITVKCGYGAAPEDTPPEIELYILAKLAEQFDPATRTERDTVQSNFVTRLLDRCRSNW